MVLKMQNPFDPGYYESDELRAFGFKSVGDNARIATNCTIIGPQNIAIGSRVRIDAFTTIIVDAGYCRIGSNVHIAGGVLLVCRGGIEIGEFAGLSNGSRVYSANDDYDGSHLTGPTVPVQFTGVTIARVAIGKHCVIGAGTTILPGVSIGLGSVVGAMSLVRKDLPEWGKFAGIPARRIGDRSRQLLLLERAYRRSLAAA